MERRESHFIPQPPNIRHKKRWLVDSSRQSAKAYHVRMSHDLANPRYYVRNTRRFA